MEVLIGADNERFLQIQSQWIDGAVDDVWDSFNPGDINWLFYYIKALRKALMRQEANQDGS